MTELKILRSSLEERRLERSGHEPIRGSAKGQREAGDQPFIMK